MAIAFRAVGTATTATTGNLASIALPTGHVANDILLLFFAENSNVVESVSGWTLALATNSGTTCRSSVWWKKDNGSETAPTVTRTAGGDARAYIAAYSGVDGGLSTPVRDTQATAGTGTATGTFNVTAPTLTGVATGDMRIFYGAFVANGDTSGLNGANWAPPASFTERADAGWFLDTAGVTQSLDDFVAGGIASVTSVADWEGTVAPLWVGTHLALSSDAAASASGAVLPIVETWTGADADPWHPRWTHTYTGGAGGINTIQGARGRMVTGGTGGFSDTNTALINASADFELTMSVVIYSLVETAPVIRFRGDNSAGNHWQVAIEPNTGYIGLRRQTGNVDQAGYPINVGPFSWSVNDVYRVRIKCEGPNVWTKYWLSTSAEPAAWSAHAFDAVYQTQTWFSLILTSGTAAAAATWEWDDLLMVTPSTAAPDYGLTVGSSTAHVGASYVGVPDVNAGKRAEYGLMVGRRGATIGGSFIGSNDVAATREAGLTVGSSSVGTGVVGAIAATGVANTATYTGTVTPAGTALRVVSKFVNGTTTPAGTLVKVDTKAAFTGTTTPAGTLRKVDTKAAFTGTVTPAGTAAKLATKTVIGEIVLSSTQTSYSDAFTATNGSAPNAGYWGTFGTGTVDIQSNTLRIQPALSTYAGAAADSWQTRDADSWMACRFKFSTAVAGNLYFHARRNAAGTTWYQLTIDPTGSQFYWYSTVTGLSIPGSVVSRTMAVDTWYNVRRMVIGNRLSAKIWSDVEAEPAWLTVTNTDITTPGLTLIDVDNATATGPYDVLIDDWTLNSWNGVPSITKAITRGPFTGMITPVGIARKLTTKASFAGTATPAGTLVTSKIYNRAFAGTVTSVGAITKAIGKVLGGTATPVGTQTHALAKALSGATTPAGAITKAIAKALAGTVTSVGTLARAKTTGLTFTGSVTSVGTIVRATAKRVTGTVTPAGAITRATAKRVTGTVTPAGAITKAITKAAFAGTITPVGTITRAIAKALAGTITPAGVIARVKQATRSFTGTITPTGVIAQTKTATRSSTGTVTPAGTIVRAVAKTTTGVITPVGTITRAIAKALAGAITPVGTITKAITKAAFAGTITPAGVITRIVTRARSFAGALTSSATTTKAVSKTSTGAVTPTGTESSGNTQNLGIGGTITPVGVALKAASKALAGSLAPTGALVKARALTFTGAITSVGAAIKATAKRAVGTVTSVGTQSKTIGKNSTGAVTPTGTESSGNTQQATFTATLTPAGAAFKAASKAMAAALTSVGATLKTTTKNPTGTVTPTGTIVPGQSRAFSGTVTPTAAVVRAATKPLAAAMGLSGAVVKNATKSLSGALAPNGQIRKALARFTSGSVAATGTITATQARDTSGLVTPTGTTYPASTKRLSGTVTSTGTATKAIAKRVGGLLTAVGDLIRQIVFAPTNPIDVELHDTGHTATLREYDFSHTVQETHTATLRESRFDAQLVSVGTTESLGDNR